MLLGGLMFPLLLHHLVDINTAVLGSALEVLVPLSKLQPLNISYEVNGLVSLKYQYGVYIS